MPEQPQITDEERALLAIEDAKFDKARTQFERQWLANRVAQLALENHRLRQQVEEGEEVITDEEEAPSTSRTQDA